MYAVTWPWGSGYRFTSAVPSEPLHGPVDVAEDSLDGLQTAFRALSVEEVVTQPVKRKRESEKDAGDEADEGEDQGQDLTNDPTFEGATSASGLHTSPSPITTTLPIPDPAAATSTPITNPPMAEGTGFTGMPAYPAYGLGPPTTAFPEATTATEPVASSSAPRWYAADYHHPLPATGTYVDVPGYAPGYATLSGLRRGPESLGCRSRGSGRSSNRSLTRSEINEVLRGATSKIVDDLTQEIREKLERLMIPPQASPTTVGVSPHRVQANHLVAGLTNTLGGLRSRPMPTPAAIPRSPFVEAGSDPRGHLGVTWGVYLCAGKPPLADIILSHPPELTRCDSVIGLAIPAMSGHIQNRGTASGDLYSRISGINRVLLS